jgi:hypothetical protein
LVINAATMADSDEHMGLEEDEQAAGEESSQPGDQLPSQQPPPQLPLSQPAVPPTGAATTTQGRKGAKKQQPEYPCIYCGKNVTSNAVQCTSCAQWCHRPCTGLSNEAFKALEIQKKECGNAFWGCRSCMAFNVKVNSQLQEAMRRQTVVEEKMERYVRNTEHNNSEINRLNEELVKVRLELDHERANRTAGIGVELRDIEMRRNNIIIHGLQEPDDSIGFNRDRIEQDKLVCGQLFAQIGVSTGPRDIRFCRRVGERGRDPRPIVVGLHNEMEKKAILERARALRGTMYDNVAIVPDMTRLQRRTEDDLTAEAANRNKQLTADDVSKNLKWLVIGKRGEKRLIKGTERDQQSFARPAIQLHNYIPAVPQPQPPAGWTRGGSGGGIGAGPPNTRGRGNNRAQQPTNFSNSYGGPSARANTASYQRGGGGGGRGGQYQNEYELGARRRDTYPAQTQAPVLLQPSYASNSNYTPIVQRGGRGRGLGRGATTSQWHGNDYAEEYDDWSGNNDSGYTDWQETGYNNDQENIQARTTDRHGATAASAPGPGLIDQQLRPRLGSKRGREGGADTADSLDGPPRTRSRQ